MKIENCGFISTQFKAKFLVHFFVKNIWKLLFMSISKNVFCAFQIETRIFLDITQITINTLVIKIFNFVFRFDNYDANWRLLCFKAESFQKYSYNFSTNYMYDTAKLLMIILTCLSSSASIF